ncbi:MAG TPA: molybdenum ABC transporter ATP-binding protein [Candidatus Sulfotelmatobacter sp.]|nr:molybdenum ABC transporter ATP-binding protein [Candidatus Sulfotelmatobacter sp.]
MTEAKAEEINRVPTSRKLGEKWGTPQRGEESPNARVLTARIRKQLVSEDQKFELDVALQANPGFTIVFGASGAGKTTLLDCVAGLSTPDQGRIAIGERILLDTCTSTDVSVSRRKVGYVLQDLALFPHLTIRQNVEYGLAHMARGKRRERAGKILAEFHIEDLAERKPKDVSGGERQRAALARTLVTDPEVLLLDEPLAALDAPTKAKILDDLRAWNRVHQIPILYVTHSREEVFALGEHAIVLDRGRLIAEGTPHEVLEAPRQETVAQLAGFENIFDAVVDSLHVERGTMTCRIGSHAVVLETPLVRAEVGSRLRVGIRAGDILLAVSAPVRLSARNIIPGRVVSLEQRDVIVAARVDCGVEMEVHLTLAARDDLMVDAGRQVWLVIKTHSCHLMK